MIRIPDIEVAIRPPDTFGYTLDVRYVPPDGETIQRCSRIIPAAHLDLPPPEDPEDKRAYGSRLGEILFSDAIRDAFMVARADADAHGLPLRFRLFMDAPNLNNICWETLQAPGSNVPLASDPHVLFSRFLSSSRWRHVKTRSKTTLRALLLIANPKDLAKEPEYPPIDVDAQLKCAHECLAGHFEITELINQGATIENLITHLRDDFDLLYVVSHGSIAEDDTRLLLDDGAGGIDWVQGRKLSGEIERMLTAPPRLAVLAPCHSAGTGLWQHPGITALGPQLAQAGIPAVVGMQGNVAQKTILKFFSALFESLSATGEIDRAVTEARGQMWTDPIAKDDWWMPVLYMRLSSGRIWYEPGWFDPVSGRKARYPKWNRIVERIDMGRCTPILGPDLSERLFGSRRDIAARWAQTFHFPLEAYRQEDLAEVAQYVAAYEDRGCIVEQLLGHFRETLLHRFEKELPDELRFKGGRPWTVEEEARNVDELIRAVGRVYREKNPDDPYRLLAQLQLPIYVTTEQTSLLEDALREQGHEARREICRWNDRMRPPPLAKSIPDRPTPERPLVYHLFGHLSDVESLMMTADDYLNYLMGVTQTEMREPSEKESVYHMVSGALNNGSILYIGFELEGRDFRVMSRVLKRTPRGQSFGGVAVQIDPDEDRILEPERVRRYVERHLHGSMEETDIYWGTPRNFLQELLREAPRARDAARAARLRGQAGRGQIDFRRNAL